MQITEQLIQRFLTNQCTPEEAEWVAAYLEQHPHVLEQYVSEDEWLHFQNSQLDPALKARSLRKIQALTGARSRIMPLRYWPAAAAVLLLILTGWWLTGQKQKQESPVVVVVQKEPNASVLKTYSNTSNNRQSVTLSDSSIVVLMPKSAISYYEPFNNNRRDISLQGTALFTVAKNKTKPFTVYAAGIATTALGTQFWVYANDEAKVSVKLIEGRVVIKAVNTLAMADVYLSPGQQWHKDKTRPAGAPVITRGKPTREQPGGEELVFDNEPLINVFKAVEAKYHLPVSFSASDLKGLHFTGTFLPDDQLDMVISSICNMNDLSFSNDGETIVIRKK